ncbi:TadG family pilus assembly protein [Caballeronia sp. GAFFF2]|uniref:TadG family pilus assembly protein n=1 Tax=Caballeronia sp. GAFFF2 TaxID=2921741 RepID=UPI0020284DA2|nr:TadG family pilus assembly protein [Caballeronia sp. GAFFF2]
MTRPFRHRPARRAQRGVAGTLAAIWLIVAVAALGAIDVGNFFFARRSLQSAADLAATAGSQVADAACTRATAAATGSAAVNGFDATASGNGMTTACGRWDTQANAAPDYFAAGGTPINAVKVVATRTVPYFFVGPARTVTATAVAKVTDIGAFSIGTTLASIGPGPINGLLNALLGTSLNLSLASYQGLADTRVKIADLVTAAGVGTVDQLLATSLTAAQIARLMVNALQTTSVANANLSTALGAMQTIASANIPGNQTISLGKTSTAPGLLSVALANTQSALNATISPLDALFVMAEIAQAGKSAVNVAGGLNLLGIAAGLTVQVVQPPVLAIGEAGQDANGNWRTQAQTAQVRASLDVTVGTLSLVLGPLFGNIAPTVHLPVVVEAVAGSAYLASTQCKGPPLARRSVIGVNSTVANVCVGDTPAGAAACSQPATLVNVLGLLTVTAKVTTGSVPSASGTLTFDGQSGNSDDYQTLASLPGKTLANALSSLNTSLSAPGGLILASPLLPSALLNSIAPLLLALLTPALTTILAGLDQVLVPVLQLLGAQIGTSTIHDLSLTCGESQLAY